MRPLLLLSALSLSACGPKTTSTEANTEPVPVELPQADAIFQAHVDASNQVGAMTGIETMKVTAVMRIPTAGIEGEILTHWAKPNQILVEQNIPGIGSGQMGFDGENGWSSDNMMGPRLMEGQELEEALLDSDMMSDINFREWYTELETLSQTDFNGVTAYEVKAVARFGRESTLYFSTESQLQVGASHSVESPMGPMTMEIFYKEFQDFGGMVVPKLSQVKTGPMTMELEVLSIETNPEIPEGFFVPPAEIQELLAEQAETEAATEENSETSTEEP
ncbi:MAG: hypothetical protein VXW32_00430 [Myxococcota bacterium]|nr:hypothetical protein [Myxococcota bacterium]